MRQHVYVRRAVWAATVATVFSCGILLALLAWAGTH